jgi:flagellin
MIIGHNLAAANAIRNTNANATTAGKSMGKLSSGLKITTAADDAAGLAISEKMKGQIRGLDQAAKNAQDGVSLVQTADGALTETTSILQRMRELANQASNDTNTDADRTAIRTEATELTAQLDNIANTTQFNTKNLLNGGAGIQGTVTSDGTTALVAGQQVIIAGGGAGVKTGGILALTGVTAATNATTTITGTTVTSGTDLTIGTAGASLQINGATVSIAAGTGGQDIADAINKSSSSTGVTATYSSADGTNAASLVLQSTAVGGESSIDLKGIVKTVTTAAGTDTFGSADGNVSITSDTGSIGATVASTTTNLFSSEGVNAVAAIDSTNTTGADPTGYSSSGNTITMHGGDYDGLQLQVDATKTSGAVQVKIDANKSLTMQIGANQGQTMNISINSMTASALGINSLDFSSQAGASAALKAIDTATSTVSSERSKLGAYQNRLTSTINNLGTISENLTSAQSSVTDVDMAKEMSEYSKNNILSQASQAMLAQANQQPQQVLQLLK